MKRAKSSTHIFDFVKSEKQRDRTESMKKYHSFDQDAYQAREGGVHDAVPVYEDTGPDPTRWHVTVPTGDEEKTDEAYICAETNLWEGTEIMIDTPPWVHSPTGLPALGKIVDSDTRNLTFSISEQTEEPIAAGKSLRKIFDHDEFVVGLYPIFNAIPYDRELDCIERVHRNPAKYAPVAGNRGVSFTPARGLDTQIPQLNDSQRHAAYYGLCADDITLIHGPPGTGKTRTLVTLIKQLVDRGNRVLACAHSNQATDNLLVGTSTSDEPEDGSLHEAPLMAN
jgi:hypothetical protein